jgi:hypothetical protein
VDEKLKLTESLLETKVTHPFELLQNLCGQTDIRNNYVRVCKTCLAEPRSKEDQ